VADGPFDRACGEEGSELDLGGVVADEAGEEGADLVGVGLPMASSARRGKEFADACLAAVVGKIADDEGGDIVAADGGADVFAGEEFVPSTMRDDGFGDAGAGVRSMSSVRKGMPRGRRRGRIRRTSRPCRPTKAALKPLASETAERQEWAKGWLAMKPSDTTRVLWRPLFRLSRSLAGTFRQISSIYFVFPPGAKKPFSPPMVCAATVQKPRMLGGSAERAAPRT
jgi:hypothetical protein